MRTKIFFAVVAAAAALCACEKGVYKDMNVDGPFIGHYDGGISQKPGATSMMILTIILSSPPKGTHLHLLCRLRRRFLRQYAPLYQGRTASSSAVRIEEFLNYFTFDYAEPGETR